MVDFTRFPPCAQGEAPQRGRVRPGGCVDLAPRGGEGHAPRAVPRPRHLRAAPQVLSYMHHMPRPCLPPLLRCNHSTATPCQGTAPPGNHSTLLPPAHAIHMGPWFDRVLVLRGDAVAGFPGGGSRKVPGRRDGSVRFRQGAQVVLFPPTAVTHGSWDSSDFAGYAHRPRGQGACLARSCCPPGVIQ